MAAVFVGLRWRANDVQRGVAMAKTHAQTRAITYCLVSMEMEDRQICINVHDGDAQVRI